MNEQGIILPKNKVVSSFKSPRRLMIYSAPKCGKTSALAELKDALILDFEEGTDFLDAVKIKIDSLDKLKQVGSQIIAEGRPYKYIIVDTITALETLAIKLALQLYKATPMGRNFDGDNVLTLPNGAGYLYQRMGMEKLLDYIDTLAPRIIYSGHIKTKFLEKGGKEVSSSEVDLIGKTKSAVSASVDAIGLLYRKGNQTILTFATKDEVICGARPDHLKNQEIVLSELSESGLKVNWNRVYID